MVSMGMSVQNDLKAVIREILADKIQDPGSAGLVIAGIYYIDTFFPALRLKADKAQVSRHFKIRDMRC